MSLLSYSAITDYPFQPFTKIYSADINLMFSTIQTLVNGNLDGTNNVKALSLVRYGATGNLVAGTANYAVFNDSSGYLQEAAQLPTTMGGLGFTPTISPSTATLVVAVNGTGTSLTLAQPGGPIGAINSYNTFS